VAHPENIEFRGIITEQIIGEAIEVHKVLEVGLLEEFLCELWGLCGPSN